MPSYYLNQCWNSVDWNLRNKLQWNLKRNSYIFIQENSFENVVCEMAAILSRPQWVNVNKPRTQPGEWENRILVVLSPTNSRRTWSIPWLLMPWILTSLGHQQWIYWLSKVNKLMDPYSAWGRISITCANIDKKKEKSCWLLCFLVRYNTCNVEIYNIGLLVQLAMNRW